MYRLTTLLSCTLGVSAFLLPSTDIDVSENKFAVAPLNEDFALYNQAVLLPCTSCAFPYKDYKNSEVESDDAFFIQGSANLLALNFTISIARPTELQLNGHTIYPFDIFTELENLSSDWTVEQIPAHTTPQELRSGDYARSPLRITGAGIGIGPVQTFTQEDEELVSIRWQLLELEEHMMNVDALYIQLIKQTNGELILLSIDSLPSQILDDMAFPMPEPTHDSKQSRPDCGFLPQGICDFTHRVAGKIHGMSRTKPTCGKGRLPTHIKGRLGKFEGMEDGHKRPHHGFPHHEHHHRHGLFHAVSKAILAILIPVMAGITVGMTVSILGLLFGRFLGWLWFTVLPRRRRNYIRIEETSYDEKDLEASEDVDALPLYEEAPAYEEVPKESK